MYDWCIEAAGKPHAGWIMGAVAFAESSVLPIPPDVMLIPISLARPDRAWRYATICTLMSVAGGLVGYLIGSVLYQSVGHWLIERYGYRDKVEAFRDLYLRYGAWIILIKGLTPIPYKIVTIPSGFAGYNVLAFVGLSIISRGMHFHLTAFLLSRYGQWGRRDRTAACLVGWRGRRRGGHRGDRGAAAVLIATTLPRRRVAWARAPVTKVTFPAPNPYR
jgi:membrane protein YqaA with SNARE-associated domain